MNLVSESFRRLLLFLFGIQIVSVAFARDTVVRGVFGVIPESAKVQVNEFYKEVFKLLSDQLFLVPDQTRSIGSSKSQSWFRLSRNEFIESHPYADLSPQKKSLKTGQKAGTMIRTIQQYLESKAVTQAVVMDCKTRQDLIITCGLYLYDRSEGRIVASSTRRFSVGIKSATAWSVSMTDHFFKGLTTIEDRKIKKMIDNMSNAQPDQVNEIKHAHIGLFGQMGRLISDRTNTPVLGILFAHGSSRKKFAMSLRGYRGSGSLQGEGFIDSGQGVYIGAVGSSESIHGLIWELGISGGFWTHQLILSGQSFRRNMMSFLLYPSLRVPLNENHHLLVRYDYGWNGILSAQKQDEPATLNSKYQGLMFAYQVVL